MWSFYLEWIASRHQWYHHVLSASLSGKCRSRADSQSALGVMYALGYGVEKNIAMARYWLQTACRNGDQNGCAMLNKL